MDNGAKRSKKHSDITKRKNQWSFVVVTRRSKVKLHFFDDINQCLSAFLEQM